MRPCGACGEVATQHPYETDLCTPCKNFARAYCWRKLQGIEEQDILPRYDQSYAVGKPYLCILCGYWHWTSNTEELPEELSALLWQLNRYFVRTAFHINVARGWSRIRYLPADAESRG